MANSMQLRIVAELTGYDGLVGAYELGTGELDVTGMTDALHAMRQVPNILRDLADQLDHGFDSGELA